MFDRVLNTPLSSLMILDNNIGVLKNSMIINLLNFLIIIILIIQSVKDELDLWFC